METTKKENLQARFDAAKALKPASSNPPSIKELVEGSSFLFEDNIYVVKNVFKYTELKKKKTKLGDSWNELELFNIDTGETKYMEVEEDDEVLVYFTDEFGIKLRQYQLNGDSLEELVDNEGQIDNIFYEDDYEARFERNGKEEDLWIMEFETGSKWLCVEGWEKGDDEYSYEVSLGRCLKASLFTILN
tara:strand:+ start:6560 stop:7126 length:567 start_codon:yes stop_codon:yes gene_type:complete